MRKAWPREFETSPKPRRSSGGLVKIQDGPSPSRDHVAAGKHVLRPTGCAVGQVRGIERDCGAGLVLDEHEAAVRGRRSTERRDVQRSLEACRADDAQLAVRGARADLQV